MTASMLHSDIVTIGVIALGLVLTFFIIQKIVKVMLLLAIVAVILLAAGWYCAHAGYLSEETLSRLNPLQYEWVAELVDKANAWIGDTTTTAVRKALNP